ncbi:hypothetical protein GGF46_002652 [Coemansia sp. RSA 552]|nr:hypothetical protein GGF46_002652 [Coemansia sp. RSA 552]
MADKGKQVDTGAAEADGSAFEAVMPVIAELLESGTRAFALGSWELAIEKFGELSSVTEQTFGSESQRYADCLVMYGRALLQHAVEQSALMAQKTLAEAAAGTLNQDAKEEEKAVSKANIQFAGEPDFRQVEADDSGVEEGSSKPAEDEDEDDDFAAAWDVLDLARVIQEQGTDRKARLKYAETLMLLGDVSMESENFEQATKDFAAALDVKKQHLEDDDRELAELYYKVALAHEYNRNTAEALELMKDVERILQARLDKSEGDEGLAEVLGDVRAKIEEWRAPPKPVDLGAMSKEESAIAEKAKQMLQQAIESGSITDLTSRVRPKNKGDVKRKPETDTEVAAGAASDTDAKRAKKSP